MPLVSLSDCLRADLLLRFRCLNGVLLLLNERMVFNGFMDLLDLLPAIFGVACLIELFIVLNVANILIIHCVSFSAFAIFCAVGFILFFILLSLSLFFEYGGYLLCLVLLFQ